MPCWVFRGFLLYICRTISAGAPHELAGEKQSIQKPIVFPTPFWYNKYTYIKLVQLAEQSDNTNEI